MIIIITYIYIYLYITLLLFQAFKREDTFYALKTHERRLNKQNCDPYQVGGAIEYVVDTLDPPPLCISPSCGHSGTVMKLGVS